MSLIENVFVEEDKVIIMKENALDMRYGGLRDTLRELRQDGIISESELNSVLLDLMLCELEDIWINKIGG